MDKTLDLTSIHKNYEYSSPYQKIGKVFANKGMVFEINLSRAPIGSNVEFVTEFGDKSLGEVVGINGTRCMAMPYRNSCLFKRFNNHN